METVEDVLSDIWDTLFQIIENAYVKTGWITEHEYVTKACNVTIGIAAIFLILLASKHLFTTYILETDGDSDMDPLQFPVKVAVALALIQMQNFLFHYLLKLSDMLSKEIGGFIAIDADSLTNINKGLSKMLDSGQLQPNAYFIAIFIFQIGIMVLIAKAFFRAVELAIMKILFPFFCCDFVTPGKERWNMFITAYLVTIFGYVVQIFCFKISMMLFIEGDTITTIIGGLALVFFAIKAPKWLEKFTYSSGVGQSAAGAGRTIAMTAVQAVRFIH